MHAIVDVIVYKLTLCYVYIAANQIISEFETIVARYRSSYAHNRHEMALMKLFPSNRSLANEKDIVGVFTLPFRSNKQIVQIYFCQKRKKEQLKSVEWTQVEIIVCMRNSLIVKCSLTTMTHFFFFLLRALYLRWKRIRGLPDSCLLIIFALNS